MDFIQSLKDWFFENAKKGDKAFWTLKREHGNKWKIVSVNNETSDPDQSWEMLKSQVISLVRDGGVRSMDVVFRLSTNDEGKSWPIRIDEFGKTGSKGAGIAGIGGAMGSLDPWALLLQQMQSNQEARIAAIKTENEVLRKLERMELENARNKTGQERLAETLERLLEKPNVTGMIEKLIDRAFPDAPASTSAIGAPNADGQAEPAAAKTGDGLDFNPVVKKAMEGYAAAAYPIDWNKPIDAALILRDAGVKDPEGKLVKFAEFLSKNPAMAEQLEAMAEAQNGMA